MKTWDCVVNFYEKLNEKRKNKWDYVVNFYEKLNKNKNKNIGNSAKMLAIFFMIYFLNSLSKDLDSVKELR